MVFTGAFYAIRILKDGSLDVLLVIKSIPTETQYRQKNPRPELVMSLGHSLLSDNCP
jgi:hypothetical protein